MPILKKIQNIADQRLLFSKKNDAILLYFHFINVICLVYAGLFYVWLYVFASYWIVDLVC